MSQSSRRSANFGLEVTKYVVSLVICACGIGAFIALKSLAKPPADVESNALVPMVRTFELQPYSGQLDLVVSGTVVPFREIRVATEVGGRIKKKFDICQAGNFVNRGEPLFEIDSEDYRLDLASIEADVKQAEKMLEETQEELRGAERNLKLAKNDYELQRKDYDRNKRLSNVLSQSEVDLAERNLLAAETQLTTRNNSIEMLKAREKRMSASLEVTRSRMKRSQLNLDRTTITAPDDGIIVREMVEQGDYVGPGTQLITFEDTSRAEVICNLTSTDLEWIRNNSKGETAEESDPTGRAVYRLPKTAVSIFERGDESVTWKGILERFDGIGRDELTKTIPCRIAIDEPIVDANGRKRALVRGMYVKCRMEVQTSAEDDGKFLSLPAIAVRPGNFIWIIRDKKLYRRAVEIVDRTFAQLGDNKKEPFVVISGHDIDVNIGELIVTSPLSQPTEGATVLLESEELSKPVEEAKASSVDSEEVTDSAKP